MPKDPKPLIFRARLVKVWVLRCVNVPRKISRALGRTARIPVRGWIEDLDFRSTLTPRGGGQHRLVVHSRIWRPLKLDVGDTVTVALFRDQAPEQFPAPLELTEGLAGDPEARRIFQMHTPAFRRQIANYVAAVKNPVSREKRAAQVLERLRTGALRGPA